MSRSVSIGIGCSSRTTAGDVLDLIRTCGVELAPDIVLATLDRHSTIAQAVSEELGLSLKLFPANILAEVSGVITHSSLAAEKVGTSSVAEASALAALGPDAKLTMPRRTGHLCTCAVAVLQ
ncbi:cobalt-precorrin 5A hydrolase [Silvibacterium bohemicum]|uniref:Cobalt-precorrin 5A hydrolase n=1 Tax=Silvibacterium bohemicum TaxID=1577686 RepID=A0A841JY47_9BACT|nr:cobalamin biosynthesis protein [Silvibacterium bohemicum]MBB6145337.1 cobalt-precorrin 5A hydrolase [Silvibacterium bohemicum]